MFPSTFIHTIIHKSNKKSSQNNNLNKINPAKQQLSNIISELSSNLSSKKRKKFNEPDIDVETYIFTHPEFKEFWEYFCKGGMLTANETEQNEILEKKGQTIRCIRTYATQSLQQYVKDTWTTYKGSLSDILIIRHLGKFIWVAVRASWYPYIFIIDIDIIVNGVELNIFEHPKPYEEAIELVIGNLGLKPSQYLLFTSPHCHLHIICHPVYKGKPITAKLIQTIVGNYVGSYELYPQIRRKNRLPLGNMQYRLYHPEPGIFRPITNTTWETEFELIKKLTPLELSKLPQYKKSPLISKEKNKSIPLSLKSKAEGLIEHGPTGSFDSDVFTVACYYARTNLNPDVARAYTKMWVDHWYRTSEGWKLEDWPKLSKDISRRVKYVYDMMEQTHQYPDYVYNKEGYCYKQDILFVKELEEQIFKRSVAGLSSNHYINRARLFRLINYLRPRLQHEWIYMPYWIWVEIVGDYNEYIAFRDLLVKKQIIEVSHLYMPDEFSKSVKLLIKLPVCNEADIIKVDGRYVKDYEVAVVVANPNISYDDFVELTGGSEDTYSRAKKRANLVQ